MQTPTQDAPNPPPSPKVVVPVAGAANEFTLTTPMTARDIDAIKARREELSDQLVSASGRRSGLLKQLNATNNETARRGPEDRIAILDKRMLQLETDIAATGQQLTSAPAGLLATTESAPIIAGLSSDQVVTLSGVFTLAVLAPLAVGAARMMWKRSNRPTLPPAVFTETAQRLERLEQSVDTIAIEIERISEGQRFVTRLLTEAAPLPALSAGKTAQIAAPRGTE